MTSSKIGPVLAACMASVTAAGCVAGPASRPVKLTAVHTPSAPTSKIDLYYAGAVRAIEARDYAQALDYLQAARAVAPEDVRVINAFGVVYDKLGRFDLSRRYYAQAKTLDPASRIVDNNLAYSDRLQGLSHEPMAFASAAEAEAKLQSPGASMPGSPVVVVPIASGPQPVIMVATIAPAEAAPELFKPVRRTQVAAIAPAPAVKPAAAQVARVEIATEKPADKTADVVKPTPAVAPVKPTVAPVARIQAVAEKPTEAAKPTPAVAPVKPTVAPIAPVQAVTEKPTEAAKPAVIKTAVKPPAGQVARVQVAAEKPASKTAAAAKLTPVKAPVKPAAKLAGAPIMLIDQSGSPDAARLISRRLTKLGWSVQISPASHGKPVAASRIDYPTRAPLIAHALSRTLPGAVRVYACAGGCTAIRLVVGRDVQTWSQLKKALSKS